MFLRFLLVCLLAHGIARSQSPCGCDDRTDVIHRIRTDQVAIAAFENAIVKIKAHEQKTGEMLEYTAERYENLKKEIKEAIAADPSARSKWGAETPEDCVTVFPDGISECIRAVLKAHEDVHVERCKAESGLLTSRFRGKSLTKYAQEEIDGYRAGLVAARDVLASTNCGYKYEMRCDWMKFEGIVCTVVSSGKVCGDPFKRAWELSEAHELRYPVDVPFVKNPEIVSLPLSTRPLYPVDSKEAALEEARYKSGNGGWIFYFLPGPPAQVKGVFIPPHTSPDRSIKTVIVPAEDNKECGRR